MVDDTVPSFPPGQLTSVANVDTTKSVGSVTVVVPVTIHPLKSVTVTV